MPVSVSAHVRILEDMAMLVAGVFLATSRLIFFFLDLVTVCSHSLNSPENSDQGDKQLESF